MNIRLGFCVFSNILLMVSALPDVSHYITSLEHAKIRHRFNGIYPLKRQEITSRTPTVHPSENFDPEYDANILRNAMRGFGTDEQTIINVLTKRTNNQRLEIAEKYRNMFGKTLRGDLRGELSGKFRDTMLALLVPPTMFYAMELNDAIRGLGTREDVLVEIICTLNNSQLREVSATYETKYEPLIEDVIMDTSGDFRDFLVTYLNTTRDETNITNLEHAKLDAEALLRAGVPILGTNEQVFYDIFCTRNLNQLRLIFDEYQTLSNHTIRYAIEQEFWGDAQKALLTFINIVNNKQGYFATRLHDSMAGLTTTDHTLIRIIVSRSEVDLGDIMEEYFSMYSKHLRSDVHDDTSGDYRRSLLSLLGPSF